MTAEEASFAEVSTIVGARTVKSVLYLGVRSGNFKPGVSGHDIALAASIWRTRPWFLVVLSWGHSVWLVVMDVGMLELIYCCVRARTVAPGVSGHDIMLAASIWRNGTWFLVEVDWIHSVVGGGVCRYFGIDVRLVRVMAERRSLRRVFTLILVGLVLTNCLVSCIFRFSYSVLHIAKSIKILISYNIFTAKKIKSCRHLVSGFI